MPEKKQLYEKLAPVEADTPELYEAFDFVFDASDITNIAVCGTFGSGKSSIMLGALKREDSIKHRPLNHITVSLAHFNNDEAPVSSVALDSIIVGNEEARKTINGDDEVSNTQTTEDGIAERAIKQHRAIGNATDDELALEANLLSQIIHQIDISHARHSKLLKKREAALWQKVVLFIGLILLSLAGVVLAFPEQVAFFTSSDYLPIVEVIAVIVFAVSLAVIIAGVIFGAVFSGIIHRLEVPGVGSAELFNAENDKEPSSLDRYLGDILYLLKTTKTDVVIFEDLDRWGEKRVLEKLRQINSLLNSSSSFKKPKRFWGKDTKPVRFFYLLKDDIFESKDRVKFFDYIIAVFPYSDFNNAANRLMERLERNGISVNPELLKIVGHSVMDSRLLNNIVNEFHQFRAWGKIEDDIAEQNERILSLVVYKNLYPSDFAKLQFGEGYLHALLDARRDLIEHVVYEAAQSNEEGAKESSIALRQSLNAKPIGAILTEYPDLEDEFFSLEFSSDVSQAKDNIISDDTLLRYFIKNRYIDNHCWVYISRAQEVMMSSHDSIFVRTVITGGKTDPSVKLDNSEGIIESLEAHQFAEPNIRVYGLISTLLGGEYRDKEDSFFEGLRIDNDKAFIMSFLQSGLCHDEAIRRIESRFPDALFYEEGILNMESEELRALIKVVLDATNNVAKLNPELKKKLSRLISEDEDFLSLIEHPDDSLVSKLSNLDVEMQSINFDRTQDKVLLKSVELGLFNPDAGMISSLLIHINGIPLPAYNNILSAVYESLDTVLGDSINCKLDRLMVSLLKDDDYKPVDTPAAVAWILGHENVEDRFKQEYIKLIPTSNLSLDNVDESFWETVLENGVADFSLENVVAYYDQYANMFDSTLITFFNYFAESGVINKANVAEFHNPVAFLKDLVVQESLEDEAFDIVFSEYGEIPDEIAISDMTPKRQEILFSYGCFSMSVNRLDIVRRNYPEHLNNFILLKKEDYLKLVESGNIAPSKIEVLLLLDIEGLDDDQKKQLLDHTTEKFSISEKYSDEINAYLINNHFDNDDLNILGPFHETGNDVLRNAIVDAVIRVLQSGYIQVALPSNAMESVLAAPSLTEDTKVSLLVQCLNNYSSPKVIEKELRAAGFMNEANLMSGGSKKIRPSESEKILITHLQNAGYLGKLKVIPSDPGSYLLHGKKIIRS